ncbi:MAG: prephenate dehydratase [Solirubrobacteraceae bacterium]
MKNSIAIQGILGSYHHEATELYFGKDNFKLLECNTFKELTSAVKLGKAHFGIIAIENSIAGTILPNYTFITNDKLSIIGEVYMPIHHHLIALKDTDLNNLTEVQSHPMALLQCMNFLEALKGVKVVESVDTALSAKIIANNKLLNVATIASKKAAEVYGLQILNNEIQTNKENFTRFFVVSKNEVKINNFNKASLKFSLGDKKGNLAKVLTTISKLNVNLTKIQSIPIIEKPWEYSFYIDVVFDELNKYLEMKEVIHKMVQDLQILGEYIKGKE